MSNDVVKTTMAKEYFTFRYLWLSGRTFLTPKDVLARSFSGVKSLKYRYICGNYKEDGRHLATVEVDEAELPLETVREALAAFAYHAKTDASALAFAEHSTGATGLKMEGREMVFPSRDRQETRARGTADR